MNFRQTPSGMRALPWHNTRITGETSAVACSANVSSGRGDCQRIFRRDRRKNYLPERLCKHRVYKKRWKQHGPIDDNDTSGRACADLASIDRSRVVLETESKNNTDFKRYTSTLREEWKHIRFFVLFLTRYRSLRNGFIHFRLPKLK